jgi:hypothetical protein
VDRVQRQQQDPAGVGIIRRMRVTPDGNLAIHQSSTNAVGLALIEEGGS